MQVWKYSRGIWSCGGIGMCHPWQASSFPSSRSQPSDARGRCWQCPGMCTYSYATIYLHTHTYTLLCWRMCACACRIRMHDHTTKGRVCSTCVYACTPHAQVHSCVLVLMHKFTYVQVYVYPVAQAFNKFTHVCMPLAGTILCLFGVCWT